MEQWVPGRGDCLPSRRRGRRPGREAAVGGGRATGLGRRLCMGEAGRGSPMRAASTTSRPGGGFSSRSWVGLTREVDGRAEPRLRLPWRGRTPASGLQHLLLSLRPAARSQTRQTPPSHEPTSKTRPFKETGAPIQINTDASVWPCIS